MPPSFLSSSLLPPFSLSLSISPVLFSSPAQVGGESGTSRRRSATLYSAASYPLLDGRMGEGEEEWGKKEEGGGEERLQGGGRFWCDFFVGGGGGVVLTSGLGSLKSDSVYSK